MKDDPLYENSKISSDKIVNENESSSDCKDDLLSSKSCKFLTSTLQAQKGFKNFIDCLIPTEGNPIDFLGCDSYLESFVPKISSVFFVLSIFVFLIVY